MWPCHKFKIFLSVFFTIMALANEVTEYRWVAQEKSVYPRGYCIEVDKDTSGEKFYKKVASSYCELPKSQMSTLWFQKADGPGGKCFVVDSNTMGQGYSRGTDLKSCAPKDIEYQMIEGRCYRYGQRTDGPTYLVGAKRSACEPKNLSPQFVLKSDGLSGNCVTIDNSTGQIFKKKLSECRPKELSYQAGKAKGKTVCYEVAKNGGAQSYIKKTNLKNCTPTDTYLKWFQEGEGKGRCLLLSKLDSDFTVLKGSRDCAALFKTTNLFIPTSSLGGDCLLIDKKTSGNDFKIRVSIKDCRPKKVKVTLYKINGKYKCVEYDSERPDDGFRVTVNMKWCHENSDVFHWVPHRTIETKGSCQEVYRVGHESRIKIVKNLFCRPQKVVYKWIATNPERPLKGECFEKDADDGLYISKVKKKYCLPRKSLVAKFFHPKKFKDGGCYLVDPDTHGKLYTQRTSDDKCRELLEEEIGR